jgi:hypothetical protein
MERKIVLEVEELEERIAPHCPTALGGDSAAVGLQDHGPHVALCLPNGETQALPDAAHDGVTQSKPD